MTNKLVVIINTLKVPKIKKILLYETKFLVPNYSCLQNPWLGGYRPRSPFSLSSVLNWICWTPPAEQNSWVRHWLVPTSIKLNLFQTHILFLLQKFRLRPEKFRTVHGEVSVWSGTHTYASPTNRTIIPVIKHMDRTNYLHFPLKSFKQFFIEM